MSQPQQPAAPAGERPGGACCEASALPEDSALILCVDVGSSSVRASLYETRGDGAVRPVRGMLCRQPLQAMDERGRADCDALRLAIESAMDALLALKARERCRNPVCTVAFASFAMNLVGLDAAGRAATPLFTYAERAPETADAARRLRERVAASEGLDALHQRPGAPIHVSYAAPTLLRLAESGGAARLSRLSSHVSYCLGSWCDARDVPMSTSEASWTGLLDRSTCAWHAPLLEHLPRAAAALLPPLEDFDADLGLRLAGRYRDRWAELAEARLLLAVGDGAAANVGSGCSDASRVAVTVGTSAAVRVVVDAGEVARVPEGLWCYRIDRRRAVVGGALTDGGAVLEWVRGLLRISDAELLEMQGALAERAAGAHGLSMLPFLSGERAVGWQDDATAAISGATRHTSRLDVLHAALESVALRLAKVLDRLRPLLPADAVLVASGNALCKSPLWAQIIADACARPILLGAPGETTSFGCAVLAAGADGRRSAPAEGTVLAPRVEQAKDIAAAAVAHEGLYARFKEPGGV